MGQVVSLIDRQIRRDVGLAGEPPITKKELAAEVRVCERTIENWQKDPTFPVIIWGPRLRRYYLSRVRAWMAAQ